MEDRYIGDGVYVSYEHGDIILDLRAQEPTLPIKRIALEPTVFANLMVFYSDCCREAIPDESKTT